MKVLSEHACFGGTQRFLAHDSRECATEMRFAVYEPPQAKLGKRAGALLPRRASPAPKRRS